MVWVPKFSNLLVKHLWFSSHIPTVLFYPNFITPKGLLHRNSWAPRRDTQGLGLRGQQQSEAQRMALHQRAASSNQSCASIMVSHGSWIYGDPKKTRGVPRKCDLGSGMIHAATDATGQLKLSEYIQQTQLTFCSSQATHTAHPSLICHAYTSGRVSSDRFCLDLQTRTKNRQSAGNLGRKNRWNRKLSCTSHRLGPSRSLHSISSKFCSQYHGNFALKNTWTGSRKHAFNGKQRLC